MKTIYVSWITVAVVVLLGIWSPAFAEVTSVTVDSATVSRSTGQVTVNGSVTCTPGDTVNIDVDIIQPTGPQQFVEGEGFTSVTCSGQAEAWTAVLTSSFGSRGFKAGPAGGNANACDETAPSPCVETTSTIHIRSAP